MTNPRCWSSGRGLQFLVVRLTLRAIIVWCTVGPRFDYGTCSPLEVTFRVLNFTLLSVYSPYNWFCCLSNRCLLTVQVICSSLVVARVWSLTITVSSLFHSGLHLNRVGSFLFILYSLVGCFCRDEVSFLLVLNSVCSSKVLGH